MLPFSQAIKLDGQSFMDVGKRHKTPGSEAKTLLLFMHGKQREHLPVYTDFLCSHVPQGNADGCTQLSKKNAKAERTGLLGNSVTFL